MVNVAGRSRGCRTCQRRRVKCDEAKPICTRCTSAKIVCDGYAERGFIQVDFSLQRKGTKKVASKPKHHYPSRSRKSTAVTGSTNSNPASVRAVTEASTDAAISQPDEDLSVIKTSPPPTLPLSAFLDSICLCFTSENLLRGLPNPEFLFPSRDPSPSALALSNVYFGVRHHDPKTTSIARKRYAKSVNAVSEVIREGKAINKTTLETVFTLGIFEFVTPNSASGWIWHYMGLGALFERLGPETISSDPVLRYIYSISIAIIAMAAMVLRRETVFSRPAWKQTLRDAEVVPGRLGEFFTAQGEILIDMPRLMVVHDEALASADPSPNLEQALSMCQTFKEQLDHWQLQWNTDCSFSFWSAPLQSEPPVSSSTGDPFWTTVLEFSGIIEANQLTRQWALSIIVASMSTRLKQNKALWEGDLADTSLEMDIMQDAATNICRSVEFLSRDYQQGIGSFMMLFPLRMAHRVFEPWDPRREWIEAVMESISGSRGSWQSAKEILQGGAF